MVESVENVARRTPRHLLLVLPTVALLLGSCAQGGGGVDLASEVATTSSSPVAQDSVTSVAPAPVTTRPAVTRSTSSPPVSRGTSAGDGPAPITYDRRETDDRKDPDVPGAPLKIPPITQKQGLPIVTVMPEIVRLINAACGTPTPCVTLVTERDSADSIFSVCQFVHTEPGADSIVPRGSTVKVVIGSQPPEVGPPCGEDGYQARP